MYHSLLCHALERRAPPLSAQTPVDAIADLACVAVGSAWRHRSGDPEQCARRRSRRRANAHYTAALSLLTEWLPLQGVEVTQVDQPTPARSVTRLAQGHASFTRKLHHPTMALTDLKAVSAWHTNRRGCCHGHTFASSFNQRPLALTTSLCTRHKVSQPQHYPPVLRANSQPLIHPLRVGRGQRPRLHAAHQSGLLVPKRLPRRAASRRFTIRLASHPQHELARRQMPDGWGHAVLRGRGSRRRNASNGPNRVRNVRLCTSATRGTETLSLIPPHIFSHQSPITPCRSTTVLSLSASPISRTILSMRFQLPTRLIPHATNTRSSTLTSVSP